MKMISAGTATVKEHWQIIADVIVIHAYAKSRKLLNAKNAKAQDT
jgi:hypothetical protein